MLGIGQKFPQFSLTGVVSNDLDTAFKPFDESSSKGKWKVVFFWPKDFTFVCPTEIAAFGKLNREFNDRDAVVYGVSIDSEFVHLAWRKDKEELRDLPRDRAVAILPVGATEAHGPHLPLDTGMAFVLVQHLDPDHESALAQILTRATRMPVLEVIDGQQVQPDNIYVIPPNTFLSIEQRALKLEPRLVGPAPHHSVDHFFESLAQDVHERAIGVVLSGAAQFTIVGLIAAGPVPTLVAVTGYGHASKQQIQQAVQTQFRLAEPPSPPDVADALAIALTHARRVHLARL